MRRCALTHRFGQHHRRRVDGAVREHAGFGGHGNSEIADPRRPLLPCFV
ncbi:MAG: hypothetical protein ACK56F_30155 [bacterium]